METTTDVHLCLDNLACLLINLNKCFCLWVLLVYETNSLINVYQIAPDLNSILTRQTPPVSSPVINPSLVIHRTEHQSTD